MYKWELESGHPQGWLFPGSRIASVHVCESACMSIIMHVCESMRECVCVR